MPERTVKGFRATGVSMVSDTRIDDFSEGGSWITYEAKPKENSGVQESQVSILWNYGLWAHHVVFFL